AILLRHILDIWVLELGWDGFLPIVYNKKAFFIDCSSISIHFPFGKYIYPGASTYRVMTIVLYGIAFLVKDHAPRMSSISFGVVEHEIHCTSDPHGTQYHGLKIHFLYARPERIVQDVSRVNGPNFHRVARAVKPIRNITDLLCCAYTHIYCIDPFARLF